MVDLGDLEQGQGGGLKIEARNAGSGCSNGYQTRCRTRHPEAQNGTGWERGGLENVDRPHVGQR